MAFPIRSARSAASAIVEIAEQSRALGVRPTAIVHCTGSGGTQAGLVVGASVAMPETRIIGIDIDAEPERVRSDVIAYARAAADLIGALSTRATSRSPATACRMRQPSRPSGLPERSKP
jgi:1-aminocyclopropane-1-carboxylate deaminase/D-cysteine desulfhydrase-like pyridoxal-dependent ACC family enzyme